MTKTQNISRWLVTALATLQFCGAAWAADPVQFIVQGGRNDLSPDGNWVFFDRVVSQKPYEMEIFNARLDGSQEQCLTCELALPRVIGHPAVHPSGRGLLMQGLTHTAPCAKKHIITIRHKDTRFVIRTKLTE